MSCQGIIWVFPKIGVPQSGWFVMENPIKMDDLGVPLFSETSICENPMINSKMAFVAAKAGLEHHFGLPRNAFV